MRETVNTLPSESRGTSLRRRQVRRKEGSHAGILRENEGKGPGVGPTACLSVFSLCQIERHRRHRLPASLGILLVSFHCLLVLSFMLHYP